MTMQTLYSKFLITLLACCVLSACSENIAPKEAMSQNPATHAAIEVTDFSGRVVKLEKPAIRVVALAPHIVENIFTVGAGDNLIGAVAYSNYPEQAKSLPLVGGYSDMNLEKIVELDPDLIIAWESGNANSSIERIKELGFNVYIDQPKELTDIAKSLRDIGALTGHSEEADRAAKSYLQQVADIRQRNQNKSTVTAFYQVWNDPLQTINGEHIISNAMALCGGANIYATESVVAPVINIESIIERDPQAIIASGMSSARPQWLDDWATWPALTAVQKDNLFFVNPDHIQRHTVRILLGIESLCSQLDIARQRGFRNEQP